jgi:hypothetical protein
MPSAQPPEQQADRLVAERFVRLHESTVAFRRSWREADGHSDRRQAGTRQNEYGPP